MHMNTKLLQKRFYIKHVIMYRLFTSKATTPDDNFILKRPLVINIQSFAFTTN